MKKLIVLVIVLGFVFTAPVFAKTVYYGCVDKVEGMGKTVAYGDVRIVEDFDLIRCRSGLLKSKFLFKMVLIDIEILEEAQKAKQPCYFTDRDGKKTEIECK